MLAWDRASLVRGVPSEGLGKRGKWWHRAEFRRSVEQFAAGSGPCGTVLGREGALLCSWSTVVRQVCGLQQEESCPSRYGGQEPPTPPGKTWTGRHGEGALTPAVSQRSGWLQVGVARDLNVQCDSTKYQDWF